MIVMTGAKSGASADALIAQMKSAGIDFGFLHGPSSDPVRTSIYALDNDCFANSRIPGWWKTKGEYSWFKLLDKIGTQKNKPLFCLLPDVVADWPRTVEMAWRYVGEVRDRGLPVAIALQDGCSLEAASFLSPDWFFVGGSTAWKWQNARRIVKFANSSFGIRTHVGRVNGTERLRWCLDMGVDSCDGTGLARFTDAMLPRTLKAFEPNPQLRFEVY